MEKMNRMEIESGDFIVKRRPGIRKRFSNVRLKYPTFHRQALASISGIIGGVGAGMTVAFTATLLPQIQKQLLDNRGSLLVDVNMLTAPLGSLLSGLLLLKFGRKTTLLYSNIPWILGWILLSVSTNLTMFLVGTAFVGFSSGINMNACIVYLTEMSEPRLRGFFLALNNSLGYSGGVLISHLLGVVFSWQNTLRISALVPTLCLLFAKFIPESPYWLIQQNRPEEASVNFFWLRGETSESKDELNAILSKEDANVPVSYASLSKNICSKMFFVPFAIVAIIVTALIGSGIDLIVYYAVDLLSSMSDDLETKSSLLTIDLFRLIAGVISCVFVKFSSRRRMYFLSSFSAAVSLIIIAITLKWSSSNTVLVICLCAYISILKLGLIPVSWSMIAEMFPQAIRDMGSGIALLYLSVLSFLIFESSTVIIRNWSVSTLYCMFAIIVSLCSIILYFVMPETDKRTLKEVEDEITNNRKSNTS